MVRIQLSLFIMLLTTFTPSKSATVPMIMNFSESAGMGDVIYLQGSNFGSLPLVEYSYNDSEWQTINPLGYSHGVITLKLLASRLPDLLNIRVSNDNGANWSATININKPIGRFIDTDQIAAGSRFDIYGTNLYLGREPTVRLLDTTSGISMAANVLMSVNTNYVLKAVAPIGIMPGHIYQIYISNGFSGNSIFPTESLVEQTLTGRAAGDDYWQIGKPWANDLGFYDNVYNVTTDPRLGNVFAAGDGTSNDLWPINHAIQVASAAGGGVVYLPAGTYAIKFSNGCGLQLMPRVVLAGPGANQLATIEYGFDAGTRGGYAVCFADSSGLVDLTFTNIDSVQHWQWSSLSINNDEVFLQRIHWNAGTSQWLVFQGDTHVAILNSVITQGLDSAFNNLGPLNMYGCSQCIIADNSITFSVCGLLLDYATNLIFQHNQVIRTVLVPPAQTTVTHSIAANFVTNLAVLDNNFSTVGSGVATNNDGEVINTEAGGPVRLDEFRGTISSLTESTLTDSSQNFFISNNAVPNLRTGSTIAIITGDAMGQTRTVTSISQDGTTVTIDHPWDCLPMAGDHYSTFDWSASNWVIADNLLLDNYKGFEMFDSSVSNLLFQNNTLIDSDGIMVSPSENEANTFGALFNVVRNIRIIGNFLVDSKGLRPAYVGIIPREDLQPSPFGTHLIGAEIRGNSVISLVPHVFAFPVDWDDYKIKTDGYLASYYWQSVQAFDTADPPPLLGTIFQGNMATNGQYAFYLNSGATSTTIVDNYVQNPEPVLEDLPLPGTSQGSVSTFLGPLLQAVSIGSASPDSNNIQTTVTNTGLRAISFGVQTNPSYIATSGDRLSLVGISVGVNAEAATRVKLTPGSSATGLLMIRSMPMSTSPFVGIGLSANGIIIEIRTSNTAPIQSNLIPFTSGSAYLKLSKDEANITAMYSSDGNKWSSYSFHLPFSARKYLVGITELSDGNSTSQELAFEGLTFNTITPSVVPTNASQ